MSPNETNPNETNPRDNTEKVGRTRVLQPVVVRIQEALQQKPKVPPKPSITDTKQKPEKPVPFKETADQGIQTDYESRPKPKVPPKPSITDTKQKADQETQTDTKQKADQETPKETADQETQTKKGLRQKIRSFFNGNKSNPNPKKKKGRKKFSFNFSKKRKSKKTRSRETTSMSMKDAPNSTLQNPQSSSERTNRTRGK
jgi:hypothetical protein